ncbi:MAG: acyl-CoA dehydrogenase C-terminal domain-containing protein, partial [Alcanivorax sediminis]|uniref:acyl-CoA dehydrogenase C-terminal domain-containing protein n=2 Tax=Alcanivorax TaxID=59753 RepID=UPI003C464A70
QGIAHAELSYQGALPYAKERKSMRALSGKKEPDAIADSLIHHGDVRRMLLKQKAIAEGGRAMLYFSAQYADNMISGILENDMKKYEHWDSELGFFTPILKGFLTEKGLEVANDGMQVFGGHGYIKEHGMEQIVRDARISTLYEGTTGIQALDLLGRKVLLTTKGKCVRDFTKNLVDFGTKNLRDPKLRPFAWKLLKIAAEWNYLTTRIMLVAAKDRDIVSTASYDFLMYSGYAMMAYFWALQAGVAKDKLENGGNEPAEFYKAKLATAEFYFERMLPSAKGHAEAALKPTRSIMKLKAEDFSFDYE